MRKNIYACHLMMSSYWNWHIGVRITFKLCEAFYGISTNSKTFGWNNLDVSKLDS